MPFEEMDKNTEYSFSEAEDLSDATAKSVLTAIDRCNKSELKGIRPFYNYCSEFVHPNIGDAITTSLEVRLLKAKDGTILRQRSISTEIANAMEEIQGTEILDTIRIRMAYEFFEKLLDKLPTLTRDMNTLLETAQKATHRAVHKSMKKQKGLFHSSDLCPCGSGKTVRQCTLSR